MVKVKRSKKEWMRRYVSFIFILFIIAFGTSLSIRANLGSSPISAPPYVLSLVPGMPLTMGVIVICMHVLFIGIQILLLRRNYELRQLTQILVSFLFGFYTDLTMWITGFLQIPATLPHAVGYPLQLVELLIGGALLAFGIACEVRCDSLMLAGEGLPLAISKATHKDFGKVKICSDTMLVAIGVVLMFCFFGKWDWKMIGVGTLVSMFYVGFMVRVFAPHIAWLDVIFIPADERKEEAEEEHEEEVEEDAIPFVITIAREYGSGGRMLGKMLAERLGVGFYDHDIIDKTAQLLGYSSEFVKENEQNISNAKLWELIFTDKSIPMSLNPSHDDAIFVSESRIIRTLAARKACVIIGRCANWVLRGDAKAFRVFVTSDSDDAVKRVMNYEHTDATTARKRIEQVNTGRSNHYLQYTGHRWTDARDYDLVVNTSKMGLDRCADIIADCVQQKAAATAPR
jgi:uncharacterized membrane protein YczE/cytidylate kinase